MGSHKVSASLPSFEAAQFAQMSRAAGGDSAALRYLIHNVKYKEFVRFMAKHHASQLNHYTAILEGIKEADTDAVHNIAGSRGGGAPPDISLDRVAADQEEDPGGVESKYAY